VRIEDVGEFSGGKENVHCNLQPASYNERSEK
jgi:hypothetical protein